MDEYRDQAKNVVMHIPSKYQKEMGKKSEVVTRVRGTQALRTTEKKVVDRLGALLPVIEDWHTQMAAMKICT